MRSAKETTGSSVVTARDNDHTSAANGIVTLLTDFGLSDPFVGVLHGVIATRFPGAKVVDLCHGIPAQDVRAAAYWLERSFAWFPLGTTHVAVVDPGVGTARPILAARLAGHQFVLPDNGLVPRSWHRRSDLELVEVQPERLGLDAISTTFHARDLFVPIGCELAAGRVSLMDLGPIREASSIVAAPHGASTPGVGRIVVVDRFGNLISDLEAHDLDSAEVVIAGRSIRVAETYASVAEGELVALVNAFGTLEVARRNGSAAVYLACGVGTRVSLTRRE